MPTSPLSQMIRAHGKSQHDLSEWASMIDDGTVQRIEIAVLSIVEDADGEEVAINAVFQNL